MSDPYLEFLKSKVKLVSSDGFDASPFELDPANKPHQNDSILWAVEQGKALIASSFGLGKSRVQIQVAQIISRRTGKPFLIVCPLGAKHQFQVKDGPALGTRWVYVRNDAECDLAINAGEMFLITNYERIREGNISSATIDKLAGVSLDEGSVLRSLGSKTQLLFNEIFSNVPYRYVATATPAPNAFRELLNYAEFLDVMDRGLALTRWFMRNPNKAGDLQLFPQHEESFWLWVSSWALFLFRPSDLGYDDAGYDLPKLNVHWHRIGVDQTRAWAQVDSFGQRRLILDGAAGISESSQEAKATLPERVKKAREIMAANPGRNWLIWHHLEREREAIEREIPEAVTVYGSQDLEIREERIIAFADGQIPILASKPEICGSGVNFQHHCYSNIFLGIDPNYRFQDFIQAIHRTWRFQQTHDVDVHIIYAESQDGIVQAMQRKWQQHDQMVENMRRIVQQYGLSKNALVRGLTRTLGVQRMETKQQLFTAVNNDCVIETRLMPENSVGMILTSIPFSRHYEYSERLEDFGHNESDEAFFEQMDFLIPELLRILKPGRIAAIHTKDLIHYSHQTEHGFMEVYPFTWDTIAAFRKHGFLFMGEHYITTDVVRENNSTNRLGYGEMCKDATKMGAGLPEKLLIFRKQPSSNDTARADEPVMKDRKEYSLARWQVDAHGYWRSDGNRALTPDELYDYEAHIARLEEKEQAGRLPKTFMIEPPVSNSSAVWDDINPMLCLNIEQQRKRKRNHVCPLPYDIVKRAITLYSNPGDLILDPFAGLFTVPMLAVKMGRRAYGIELNTEYYEAGLKYCREAEQEKLTPSLFDYLKAVQAQPAQGASAD
ncbi:MAG TPA: DNA methyltransferase [Bellilinea sp.]|nr:DNA methyltransferase [Bellilinea sp.]